MSDEQDRQILKAAGRALLDRDEAMARTLTHDDGCTWIRRYSTSPLDMNCARCAYCTRTGDWPKVEAR